jgi:glycopeptide antibiotics resistance protein
VLKSPSAPLTVWRLVAWLAVILVTSWLLSMTLRTTNEISLGRIRLSDPVHELNLQPFRNKIQPLRSMLQSPSPRTRRAAGAYLFVDVLGNFAVFVPFGLALAVATVPGRRQGHPPRIGLWLLVVSAAGLVLSLFIEIAQLAIPSRVTDIDDVILNTLGAAVGGVLVWWVFRLVNRP